MILYPFFFFAILICLSPTTCAAAALRNPGFQSITQADWNCIVNPGPNVSLPSDNESKSYLSPGGLNCIDDGNPHEADCWDVLELDEWLPQWFLDTPQCPHNATLERDCNRRDPPESWTTTFMRMATRGGDWNGCSDISSSDCQYSQVCSRNDLLSARYSYVAYTISSTQRILCSSISYCRKLG